MEEKIIWRDFSYLKLLNVERHGREADGPRMRNDKQITEERRRMKLLADTTAGDPCHPGLNYNYCVQIEAAMTFLPHWQS